MLRMQYQQKLNKISQRQDSGIVKANYSNEIEYNNI